MAEKDLSDIASLKQGPLSTAKILIKLARAAMNVPDNISDKDPTLINYIILNSRTSATRETLQTTLDDYTRRLSQLSGAVQASLGELGKVKTTIPLRDNYSQEHAPLKENVATLTAEQEKLARHLLEIIQDQQKSIPDLFKQLSEGKISKNDLLKQLQPFMSKQDTITLGAVKLQTDEQHLWQKLESLYTASSQAAAVATGVKIEAPEKPQLR